MDFISIFKNLKIKTLNKYKGKRVGGSLCIYTKFYKPCTSVQVRYQVRQSCEHPLIVHWSNYVQFLEYLVSTPVMGVIRMRNVVYYCHKCHL